MNTPTQTPPRHMRTMARSVLLLALLLCPPAAHAQNILETLREFETAPNWSLAGAIHSDPDERWSLVADPGQSILVNQPTEDAQKNIFTTWEHADMELELEFQMPKGSNSGIYLQGRYEIQLRDSWGVVSPTFGDCGGIYQRWNEHAQRGYEGRAPRFNASRAPGVWQKLHITFQAPRFDTSGEKTENARFVRVVLNGAVIHENVQITGPTRSARFDNEEPTGPLMIQGDHGPVAFRNMQYRLYSNDRIHTTSVHYELYEGDFEQIPDLVAMEPEEDGVLDQLLDHTIDQTEPLLVAYKGTIHIPTTGTYKFILTLNWITGDPHFQDATIGGGTLRIGEHTVLHHAHNSPVVSGTTHLEAGSLPFSLIFFKSVRWQLPNMTLHAEGPGIPRHLLTAPKRERPKPGPILVEPSPEPVVLRGFVQHGDTKRTHTVSVGNPEGVHYSLDLQAAALLHVWRGPFVDATPMWHNRGQDQLAVPQGSVLTLPGTSPFAFTDNVQFLGYDLDSSGHPTFRYAADTITIEDRLRPASDGPFLTRELIFRADQQPVDTLLIRIATGTIMHAFKDGQYAIDDQTYYVTLPHPTHTIRQTPEGQELLVPLFFEETETRLSYAIVW